jgi:hypothetical protein
MYNPRLYMNIKNYGNYIAEASAVLSEELNPRLKQYLEDDPFLEYLATKFSSLESGETYELTDLPKSEYGLREEDNIWVKVDKSDPKIPKFMMWIMNDEYLYGGIDFNLAATILYEAGNVGSAVGYVGNLIGGLFGKGDPGDSGTDEDTVVAVCGAMAAIAAEKSVDPKLYYDKLAEAFNQKYGSLTDFLETEFSGRAESAALAAFRQPIDASVSRGLNLGSILLDIGLTIVTFGGGTAVAGALRGAGVAAKSTRIGAGVVNVGSKLLKGPAAIAARFGGWVGLSAAQKTTYLGSAVKVGEEISYITRTGKNAGAANACKIIDITENGVQLQNVAKGNTFMASLDDFVLGVPAATGNRILDAAGLTATAAGLALATKKTSDIVGASSSDVNADGANWAEKGAEIMGWYDTLAADPNQYMASLGGSDAAGLAQAILDLKKGSGLFGNTTDQEELAMALIILSLTPEGAKQVKDEYAKLDDVPVYAVIDDELGGDMGLFAKSYWSACTGEGNMTGPIKGILAKIRKK